MKNTETRNTETQDMPCSVCQSNDPAYAGSPSVLRTPHSLVERGKTENDWDVVECTICHRRSYASWQ